MNPVLIFVVETKGCSLGDGLRSEGEHKVRRFGGEGCSKGEHKVRPYNLSQ